MVIFNLLLTSAKMATNLTCIINWQPWKPISFFNVICARLYAEIPDIKILTCHDQIYFEQRFYDQVDSIWNEELKKVYALLPIHEEMDLDYDELGILQG